MLDRRNVWSRGVDERSDLNNAGDHWSLVIARTQEFFPSRCKGLAGDGRSHHLHGAAVDGAKLFCTANVRADLDKLRDQFLYRQQSRGYWPSRLALGARGPLERRRQRSRGAAARSTGRAPLCGRTCTTYCCHVVQERLVAV